MKQTCPLCNAPLEIPDEYAGQEVTCAACNQPFVCGVGEETAQAPEAEAAAEEDALFDAPPAAPLPPPRLVDRVTPTLFRQFVTIEDSMKAIRGKIARQVWTCFGLILGGALLDMVAMFLGKEDPTVLSVFSAIGGALLILSGIVYTVCCVEYWVIFKIACWRTAAINSGLPAVYAVDPRRSQE